MPALPEIQVAPEAIAALRSVAGRYADIDALEADALQQALDLETSAGEPWQALADDISAAVDEKGYAVLRGMDLDDGKTLVLLSTCLGAGFDAYGANRIVKRFRMSPWTRALSHTVKAGDFHTDGNVSVDPPVATLMQCEVEDPGGDAYAEQRVANLTGLLAYLAGDDELRAFLTEREAVMSHEGSSQTWRGRLVENGRIRYHPASLRIAAGRSGAPTPELESLMARLHDAAMAVSIPFHSRPGDVLIVSNTRALHYRGECSVRFTDFPSTYEARSLLVMHRAAAV